MKFYCFEILDMKYDGIQVSDSDFQQDFADKNIYLHSTYNTSCSLASGPAMVLNLITF